MYAIVEIAGHQYKVQKDQLIFVNRLQDDEGAKVSFDNVLLIDNDGKVNIGAPAISGAQITAKVERHLKGDKVIIFKKKRRKGYRKKNGFRASLTELRIEGITESGAKPAAKKEAAPKAAAPVSSGDSDLSRMTVADLKEMAKNAGLSGYTSMKKAELIEALSK